MRTPKFVIKQSQNHAIAKSKYSNLTNQEKLQVFIEMACYGKDGTIQDLSDPDNIDLAHTWFKTELGFLRKRDCEDLIRIWQLTIDDGSYARTLFTAIKNLQDKY